MKNIMNSISTIVIIGIRVLLLLNIIRNFYINNYYFVLIGVAALTLTFLTTIYCKLFKNKGNNLLNFSITFFVFLSLYLGTLNGFYKFPWWDTMLHFVSGILIGLLAIILMNALNGNKDLKSYLSPKFIFLYIISFVALSGVLWEIYEFTIDTLFGLDMQGVSFTGVTDTMEDFIAALIGGIIPAFYGYITFKDKFNS
ncbi:hypothetical protein [Clostridium lundense]|uniref:hypothetical protein n=1 Tax=Clostridium lundense TaxID=319475 RepID=UPI000A939A91|nr:hypothetical protein [Clostridium lundense]